MYIGVGTRASILRTINCGTDPAAGNFSYKPKCNLPRCIEKPMDNYISPRMYSVWGTQH